MDALNFSSLTQRLGARGRIIASLLLTVFPRRRLRFGTPDREDLSIIDRVRRDLHDIQNSLQDQPPDAQELRERLFDHLLSIADATSTLIESMVQSETAVSLKLLWRREDELDILVRTIVRDSASQLGREWTQPPNYYPYSSNTAFDDIVRGVTRHRYFASDNLSALEAQGRYKNSRAGWPHYYNTTAVIAIPVTDTNVEGLIGFLCIDTKYGHVSSARVRRSLELMSGQVYNAFRLLNALERPTQRRLKALSERALFGWKYRDRSVVEYDGEYQKSFQQSIDRLVESYKHRTKPVARRPRLDRGRGASPPSHSEGAPMSGKFAPMSDLVTNEMLEPELAAALKKIDAMSEDDFVGVLRRVAPGNPYAEDLLRAAEEADSD